MDLTRAQEPELRYRYSHERLKQFPLTLRIQGLHLPLGLSLPFPGTGQPLGIRTRLPQQART